jgi:hypothetical protein
MKIAFIGATQFLVMIGISLGCDDPPPSSVRPWAPPSLPRYEGELRQYQPTEAEPLAGATIGGVTSFAATWAIQQTQARAQPIRSQTER